MTFLRRHFPESRTKAKVYLKVFLPIVLGSIMFALNGVVDNFMVGHIDQGQAALGAINSWTAILMGWFAATAAAGSVITGQFYFAKQYKTTKEIARYRFYLSIIPAIILAIIAWTAPDFLTKLFVSKPEFDVVDIKKYQENLEAYNTTLTNARDYAHVIAIQWILISITFNLGNQLREIGFGFYTMMWGIGTLTANITLNSILMYGYGMGVEGAAWASVAGRIVAMTSGITVIIVKKIQVGFNPLTIFNVSLETRKLFWKRWVYIVAVFTVNFFITLRTFFYSRGYETGSLGVGVSGISVIALTGALMNIFTTTFNALTSMSSRFVGSELGKGNIEQAKINGDELKGFLTLISAFFGLLMAAFALAVPYMDFLAETKYDGKVMSFDGQAQLKQVSHALLVLALYYPIWIWFSCSYRIGNSGGKGSVFALIDWVVTALQLLWLWLIVGQFVPGWDYAEHNFWVTYIFFFLSDIVKLVFMEYFYYKYRWLNKLTKDEVIGDEVKSKDVSELNDINRR